MNNNDNNNIVETFKIDTMVGKYVYTLDPMIILFILVILTLIFYISMCKLVSK